MYYTALALTYSHVYRENMTVCVIPLLVKFCQNGRSCHSSCVSHLNQRVMTAFHRPLYNDIRVLIDAKALLLMNSA